MERNDVYCIEDYYLDESEKKMHLMLFNTSAFYRDIAGRMGRSFNAFLREPMSRRLRESRSYVEALDAVNVQEMFEEETIDASSIKKRMFGSRPVQYVIKDGEGVFNARNSTNENYISTIQRSLDDSRYYGKLLRSFSERPPLENILTCFSLKYAAIVNVGCGNCCFVFDENNVVMIDCSNREKRGGLFQANVDAAIAWIRTVQKNKPFHVDCFLLTHPHYDHYSGVCDFVRWRYIDSETVYLINLQYQCSVGAYIQMKASLCNAGLKYHVNPVAGQLVGPLNILHPIISPTKCRKVNNASVLSAVRTVKNSDFVFTGDIEKSIANEGWNVVPQNVMQFIQQSGFYMLSHHGSRNGFGTYLRGPMYSFCSTRPGVYNGVPDPNTLAHFQNLMMTNTPGCRYIAVDFAAGAANYM